MALPTFNMRQLLEAGVHFGHQKHRWNPKMSPYIFGVRNNIHIIDLAQTVPMLHQALLAVSDTVARGGRVLFVGTKRQASDSISDAAKRCAQYYVNHRWLGGTLTNWKTISNSIKRLRHLDDVIAGQVHGLTKKELLGLTNERDKLERALGGIKDMGGVPDILFVIDTNKESIAIAEARKLGLPVIAVVDTNCSPDGISHPIPGNDDAGRAITLYCDLIAKAAIDGIERAQGAAGLDLGEAEAPLSEDLGDDQGAGDGATAGEARPARSPSRGREDGRTRHGADRRPPAGQRDKGSPRRDGFRPLAAPDGDADDLKRITGVGPAIEQKLNENGIFHFWQIASMRRPDVLKIEESIKGRFGEDWIKQARALSKEKARETA